MFIVHRLRLDTMSASMELIDAAKLGDLEALERLLRGKVNVNAVDDSGFTALHW